MSDVEELSPAEVKKLMEDGKAVLVDVREPNEFFQARIPGALLYPLSTFDPRAIPADESRKVILHCGIGQRSMMAGLKLLDSGRATAAHMSGGLRAWREEGYTVYATDPATGEIRMM